MSQWHWLRMNVDTATYLCSAGGLQSTCSVINFGRCLITDSDEAKRFRKEELTVLGESSATNRPRLFEFWGHKGPVFHQGLAK